ncbi:NifB/NifX family molybdenum-iron cluster-binding protein [Candidatus Micrarchaeota archaeon]|nr:NifB/NifX family molybdenum-iron cluster-binding protein [Candidatus Micrarchaeota archaeon]
MKIVVATEGGADGNAAAHFAHCSNFVVFEIEDGKIKNTEIVKNPYCEKHVPGAIPEFVRSLGANVLITDGIGPSAIALFGKMDIEVVYGAKGDITGLVDRYLKRTLKTNENSCNH